MTEDQRIARRNRRWSQWMDFKELCGTFIEWFFIIIIATIIILMAAMGFTATVLHLFK